MAQFVHTIGPINFLLIVLVLAFVIAWAVDRRSY